METPYNDHPQVLVVVLRKGFGDNVLKSLAEGLGHVEAESFDESVIDEIVFAYQDGWGHTVQRQDTVHCTPTWLRREG